jgi:hypothetical protein
MGQSPTFARENDYDPSDDSCKFCGSLDPHTLMERLEVGNVLLGSTDKNYKVYVTSAPGAPLFKQTFRDCYNAPDHKENPCKGLDTCTHWVTRETTHTKFYFQHLSNEQRTRFIALANEKKLKFEGDYGFYVLPFFCQRVEK